MHLGARAALVAVALAAASAATAQDTRREPPRSLEQIHLSFAPVVKRVAPAVVNVYSERVITSRASPFEDEFFNRFFGNGMGGAPRERISRSLGSGVIVRSDGIVVTNNHVVAGADQLRVTLADRREFPAKVVVADQRTDIAVLRIDAKGESLPTLPFNEDGGSEVGDLVLAIGNPFGVGQTVTQGIVSALGRSDVTASDYAFFIQTDAAINPGNSGGALVDVDGRLIGINTAIFSRSGGSEGIGFAIPAELVERVVEGALTEGRIVRPWFGARGQTVTPDIANSLGLDRPRGVLVNDVFAGGPAANAGVSAGDVVLAIDDAEVDTEQALNFRLATHKVGDRAAITVWRDGRERQLRMTAAAPPENPPRDLRSIEGASPFTGARVANFSPGFNEESGIDPFRRGVGILSVRRGSQAEYYGFQPGDVIKEVNGKPVKTTVELERALAAANGARLWSLVMDRGGRESQLTLRF